MKEIITIVIYLSKCSYIFIYNGTLISSQFKLFSWTGVHAARSLYRYHSVSKHASWLNWKQSLEYELQMMCWQVYLECGISDVWYLRMCDIKKIVDSLTFSNYLYPEVNL